MAKVKTTQEQVVFEHKGIKINLSINYEDNDVSMIESTGEKKRWVFTDRGREYMQGWLDILEAMAEATKYAKAKLDEYYKNAEKERNLLLAKAHNASKDR